MIATQDNTILIDFDTYTFHKGDKITLSYYNPFYINVDNAPDVQSILQTSESNTCGMVVVPKDTLLWNNQDVFKTANGTIYGRYTFPYNTNDSATIIKNIIAKEFPGFGVYSDDQLVCCYTQGNAEPNPCMSGDTTVNSSIFYTSVSYNYQSNYTFPLTRSISLFMSSTDLPVYTIPQSFDMSINRSVFTIQQGDYTAKTFHNTLSESIKDIITGYGRNHIDTTNKYIYINRFYASELKFLSNEQFDSYYNKLHTFHTYPSVDAAKYVRFVTSMYPTFRSLSIPSGEYTKDSLVNYINTHTTLFTAEAIDNTIYIKADKPFIFNPAMTLHNDTTDLSTTFTTSHTLAVIPQQRETFNITFENHSLEGNYTLQGTYSPAEFLRAVRDLTGCSFYINKFDNLDDVHGYISNILCDEHFDIDCSYFKFTNELSNGRYRVYNKVNLNRMNKQINITNTFLQSGINEYTPITQSSIFTIKTSNEMQNSGLLRIINKDNNTVLTTAIDDHMYNCTHSCGISIYPYQYCSLSGRMLCTFSSAGDITYSCGSENYTYHATSSGTHTICVNSPCRPYNNLYVQGNVKCDFTEVSICANNVPIMNN